TNYGGLIFNHVDDGTFYGDVNNLGAAANRILLSLKAKVKPTFMLAGYQRFRQDDFITRPDAELADITIGRLKQLTDNIKADTLIGKDVEIVTPEMFSVLLRKKLGTVSVPHENIISPLTISLEQNYPNPFNPSTVISFNLPFNSNVELKIYDILGKEIRTLVSGEKTTGNYSVRFDAGDLPSGIYIYKLTAGDYSSARKMILIR
ncbi:MAG: T9SS type A sorting domain-containing protein, partial [Bacillota bacterium]